MPQAPRTGEVQINKNETIEVHNGSPTFLFLLYALMPRHPIHYSVSLPQESVKQNRWNLIVFVHFLPVLLMVGALGHVRAVTWLLNIPTVHIQCVPVIISLTLLFSWGQESSR